MTITDMYERVLLTLPDADERMFLDYYNDTLTELDARYGTDPKLLFTSYSDCNVSTLKPASEMKDPVTVLPLFHSAIVDNILYLFTLQQTYKQEFLRKAEDAHLVYWRRNARGKRIKSIGRCRNVQKSCKCNEPCE